MSRRALVVTVGESRKESLGAMKLAAWLRFEGWHVCEAGEFCGLTDSGFDLYAFSAVFSWHLPRLCEWAAQAKGFGEVWIGGPAVTFHPENEAYVRDRTGIVPTTGIDERFERQAGAFPMVYFSRGCPAYGKGCGPCPVPRIEGSQFRYYPDAVPASLLLDNNLSALPGAYQDHIIRRYRESWKPGRKVDCQSGFEPHTFTEETLLRWKDFPLSCWRFGYDHTDERDEALRMMALLRRHGIGGERVRVYTLAGNEPYEACERRVREVIENGCHPWPQRMRPLNYLGGPLPTFFGWDEPTLIAFQRFYSYAALWKRMKPGEFYYQKRYPLRRAS